MSHQTKIDYSWEKGRLKGLDSKFSEYIDSIKTCKIHPESIIEKIEDAYNLETLARFIKLKLCAALYHYQKLCEIISELPELWGDTSLLDLNQKCQARGTLKDVGSGVSVITQEKRLKASSKVIDLRIIFEFEGVLYSLRSVLDFCTMITSKYFRGTNFKSVNKLKKYLEKNKIYPFSEFIITQWEDWVEDLKEYRDDLIHRYCVRTEAVQKKYLDQIIVNGVPKMKESVLVHGFFIPRKPKFTYWLPGYEAGEGEDTEGITTSIKTSKVEVDGRMIEMDIEREIEISPDYIDIKEYSKEQIDKTASFVSELLKMLINLDFGYVN